MVLSWLDKLALRHLEKQNFTIISNYRLTGGVIQQRTKNTYFSNCNFNGTTILDRDGNKVSPDVTGSYNIKVSDK